MFTAEAIAKAARWVLCVVSVADRTAVGLLRDGICAGLQVPLWQCGGVMEAINVFITS